MKISKFILACLLGGVVGNAFAEPVRVICKYEAGKTMTEVEFDDNYKNQITVRGKTIYKNSSTSVGINEVELLNFSPSSIEWVAKTSGSVKTTYTINRITGRITQEFEIRGRPEFDELTRGTCTPVENKGF